MKKIAVIRREKKKPFFIYFPSLLTTLHLQKRNYSDKYLWRYNVKIPPTKYSMKLQTTFNFKWIDITGKIEIRF